MCYIVCCYHNDVIQFHINMMYVCYMFRIAMKKISLCFQTYYTYFHSFIHSFPQFNMYIYVLYVSYIYLYFYIRMYMRNIKIKEYIIY